MVIQNASQRHLEENALTHARTTFLAIPETHTIREALAYLQQTQPSERIIYFYAVDSEGKLTGVIPARRMLLSTSEQRITEIMVKNVVALPDTATLLDVCEFFLFHRFLAFPIVDSAGKILGVVDVELYSETISDLAHRQESDDFFQLVGVRLAQVQTASIPRRFSKRFPWLLCNIGGGLAAAILAACFHEILESFVALALFIPVVLALAESVSIQSLTLILQAQHRQQKTGWREFSKQLVREFPVGLLLGVGCASGIAVASFLWKGDMRLTVCLFLSILTSVTIAALFGVLIPTLLKLSKCDPKIASGPITLALTDITALFSYLGLATLLLR